MNKKSSKKHVVRDIPKFRSTKFFGSCSVLYHLLTSVYRMQWKMYPNEDLSGVRLFPSPSCFFSNKQRERKNKKMLAEEAGKSRYLVPTLHSC
jgi:uracil-DNA glycosylase